MDKFFSFKQYHSDKARLTQNGTVDSDIQKQSPTSAGSRGLRKIDDFTKAPNQMMKQNYFFDEMRSFINIVDTLQKKD